ncbi:MAG: SGNH/GDSL hydrolase family protein [Planctomycetota bacterium]
MWCRIIYVGLVALAAVAAWNSRATVAAETEAVKPEAEPSSYLADLREPLTAHWPDNRTVYVVCHGHSVPAGYFRTPDVRPFDSYPHLTHRAVQQRYPTAMVEFVRTAIGGENSEQGAARFADDVLAKKPDVVTIDYSLNDRPIGLERAERAWRSMIEAALAADVRVILLTPTPDLSADLDDADDPLNQHAGQVRRLAEEYGVGLVDSAAIFLEARDSGTALTELMSQGNHPNRAGHELVAAALAEWFTDLETP